MSAQTSRNPEPHIPKGAPSVSQQNLHTVAAMEDKALGERTLSDRIVDMAASTLANIQFWGAHLAIISLWVLFNSGRIPYVTPWDPWPFGTLTTVLSLESIIISCTVLMIQGRMKNQQAQRTHLDLQISLLQEREATKTLHLLRAICRKLEMTEADDLELEDLVRVTDTHLLHDEVKEKLITD